MGFKCNQKIPHMQNCDGSENLERVQAKWLVLLSKLDALLDGGFELGLEAFQPLLLEVREGTQSKYLLNTIFPKPYLRYDKLLQILVERINILKGHCKMETTRMTNFFAKSNNTTSFPR